MVLYIIAALLLFGILIAVHELGHFLAAKACGVRVNEFAIGMGPTLWQKQKGETQYSLRAFPVGGFCAMEGEEEESDDPAALNNQGFWKKLLIFAAGAAMNFLAGLLIIFFLYLPAQGFYQPVLSGFADGCPLQGADGLQVGDRLVSIDGERVYVYSDVSLLLGLNNTGVFDLVVDRGGEKVRLDDFAMERQTYTDQSGNAYSGYGLFFGAAEATFGDKLAYTWNNAVDFVRLVRLSLQMLVNGQAGLKDLSGPVGIVSTMVQVGEQSESTRAAVENIAYIGALVAVNLAVMNLLPLPALDGGRIFFLVVNAVAMLLFKKKIPAKYENYIHFAGLVLLLALMVVLVFSDVGKLIR
jgi:regulator of sigma E protease